MATNVSSVPAGDLTQGAYVDDGGTDDSAPATAPNQFTSPDTDETMLPAEQGAQGLVGPVTGAQHMPNAAQPGH